MEFHDHVGNAKTLPYSDLHFTIPFGLTNTWKNGRSDIIIKFEILGVCVIAFAVCV